MMSITSLVSLVSGAITDMAFRLARSASSCNSGKEENLFPLASLKNDRVYFRRLFGHNQRTDHASVTVASAAY